MTERIHRHATPDNPIWGHPASMGAVNALNDERINRAEDFGGILVRAESLACSGSKSSAILARHVYEAAGILDEWSAENRAALEAVS